jgi:hypothetical protein
MTQCKLYRIQVESAKDEDVKVVRFYAYHMNERLAREAAVRWGKAQFPKTKIKILQVD